MKLKSELYKNEKIQICDTIIEILNLNNSNSTTLYELDNKR
jgi:hypothetical protein